MTRGNRKESLNTRLAALTPRGIQPVDKIPGTNEFHRAKQNYSYNEKVVQKRFFDSYTLDEEKAYALTIPTIPNTNTVNENIIDDINRLLDENGWEYIDGGEYNGGWVNSKYEYKIFKGTTCTLPTRNGSETMEFPITSHEEDPLGLGFYYMVTNSGTKTSVLPNKWVKYDTTYRGRRQVRTSISGVERLRRYTEFQEAEKIKNPIDRREAIQLIKFKHELLKIKIVEENF